MNEVPDLLTDCDKACVNRCKVGQGCKEKRGNTMTDLIFVPTVNAAAISLLPVFFYPADNSQNYRQPKSRNRVAHL